MSIISHLQTDLELIKRSYEEDKRTQVLNILEHDTAGRIAKALNDDILYENAYYVDNQFKTISLDQLERLSPQQQTQFMHDIYKGASQGEGFYYGRKPLKKDGFDKGMVQQAFEWLNANETLESIKHISGFDDIVAASAQATRFYPGHFLTRHNDIHATEQRRVAYVLNLTPKWHPDWCGLLQFYYPDGAPKDAWVPHFNSLCLFDVNHVHGVTHVAPFATQPRLSISGWFRATPL